MLELYFSVKANTLPGDNIRIAGSSSDLGTWNPVQSLSLTYKAGNWEGSILNVRTGSIALT